jgi:sialic acid synthase SpsE
MKLQGEVMNNIPKSTFKIGNHQIGLSCPSYFIADIGANHDGSLERAKELIYSVADSGGNAVKFQHFKAGSIVSQVGFDNLKGKQSHQSKWKKSVFEVYQDASLNADWTKSLMETAKDAGLDFFTSPYSIPLVDEVDPYICAYKVGSGDITWTGILDHMSKKGKPILVATGASTTEDVQTAMSTVLKNTNEVVLMQCNTNYTASLENFKFIQLNVLNTYKSMYPTAILGLSDHTPGHATVLGAVALGARVIEKHFTDDNDREGPDHPFAMNPGSWKEMVERTRELENALGDGIKRVEYNEKDTVKVQRRAIRAIKQLNFGDILKESDIEHLRPCPDDGIPPLFVEKLLGKKINSTIEAGSHIRWTDLELL